MAVNVHYSIISEELCRRGSVERAQHSLRFFKTGKGEYGEGDCFLGVTMPDIRKVVRKFRDVEMKVIEGLLQSKYHEERMCGLLIVVDQFERGDNKKKKMLFDYYVAHSMAVNNWDLVDVTVHKVIGSWVFDHRKEMVLINQWVKSLNMWERRMAMISMAWFIREGDLNDPMRIVELLVYDTHDLMHKAVGWMLREVGKQDRSLLESFLKKYCKTMPRTMLRYAIEKFPEGLRQQYLRGQF